MKNFKAYLHLLLTKILISFQAFPHQIQLAAFFLHIRVNSSPAITMSDEGEPSQLGNESTDYWKRDDLIFNPDLPFRPKRKPISPRMLRDKRAVSSSIKDATKTTQNEAFR